MIDRRPSVDAAPVVYGHWKAAEDDEVFETVWQCSECKGKVWIGESAPAKGNYNYCPCCGARMDFKEKQWNKNKRASVINAVSVRLDGEDFGTVLACAVRCALERQTYMPGLVVDFVTPLLPYVSGSTLRTFDRAVTEEKDYGDPKMDKPLWLKFLAAVRAEEGRRNMMPYGDWSEITNDE
jgi:DNA-directed RNA polymerase subunit RPC12/RpoP